jgi:uncharacterized protein YcnI
MRTILAVALVALAAPAYPHVTLEAGEATLALRVRIPEGMFAVNDELVLRRRTAGDLAAGDTLWFPLVQACAGGAERWIEIPAAGQDREAPEHPAPGVRLIEERGH